MSKADAKMENAPAAMPLGRSGGDEPELHRRLRSLAETGPPNSLGNLVVENLLRPGQEKEPDADSLFIETSMPAWIKRHFRVPEGGPHEFISVVRENYILWEDRGTWGGERRLHLMVLAYVLGATVTNLPPPFTNKGELFTLMAYHQRLMIFTALDAWLMTVKDEPASEPTRPECYDPTCEVHSKEREEYARRYREYVEQTQRNQSLGSMRHHVGKMADLMSRGLIALQQRYRENNLSTDPLEEERQCRRQAMTQNSEGDELRQLRERVRQMESLLPQSPSPHEMPEVLMEAEIDQARRRAALHGDVQTDPVLSEALAEKIEQIKRKYGRGA